MEMILLDWTRMGKTYCLAGAVLEKGAVHRPAAILQAPTGQCQKRGLVAVAA